MISENPLRLTLLGNDRCSLYKSFCILGNFNIFNLSHNYIELVNTQCIICCKNIGWLTDAWDSRILVIVLLKYIDLLQFHEQNIAKVSVDWPCKARTIVLNDISIIIISIGSIYLLCIRNSVLPELWSGGLSTIQGF